MFLPIHVTVSSLQMNKYKRITHTVSLMRCHYPAKEETGRGEQLQLHGDWILSNQINNLQTTLWPTEFNMGHHDKVEHAHPEHNQSVINSGKNTRCL